MLLQVLRCGWFSKLRLRKKGVLGTVVWDLNRDPN